MGLLLGGCAGDSATPLGAGSGPGIETSSASLDGTVGSLFGGDNTGVIFKVRGSAAGALYYWSVSGATPPGLTKLPLNDTLPSSIQSNTFTLQGTPTACGQYPIQIVVHSYPDHQVVVQPSNFTMNISGTCGPPEITTTLLTWFKGLDASQQLALTGGTPPYTWSISDPSNLGITLSNPTAGMLRWNPTTPGEFDLSVTVTDAINRVDTKSIKLTVRSFTLSDFTGTWSGIISQGKQIKPGPIYIDLTGQRLSVLLGDPIAGTDVQGKPIQVDPVNQATLGSIVLAPVQAGKSPLQFSLELGPFPGLLNGPIPQMNWHFSCDPNVVGDLVCVGHSYSGVQYNTNVTLTRLSSISQDDTKPSVSTTIPADGAQGVTSFDVTVTFNEPMSSSASVAIDGGAGVEPVTFDSTDPKTATFKLSGLQSNSSYTLTLNPDPSAPVHFMDLAGNALPTSTMTFKTGLLNATTLSVTKNGTGGGTVTSNPAGIDCGITCSAAFAGGNSVILTASPTSGSTFAGWSGDCANASGTCTVTMDTAKSVTATFTLQPYALSVTKAGTGAGTISSSPAGITACSSTCSASFDYGTNVTLTATAATGSTFTGWSGAGCSGSAACLVSMTAAQSVTATFTLQPYALSVTKAGTGAGTISSGPAGITACSSTCSASFDYGTNVTLTATAATGSTFTGWSGAGCSGSAACVVSMTATQTVTATFTLQTYALTVVRNGTGSGTVTSNLGGIACGATCSATYDYNTAVTLTPSASSGSTFTGWSGACSGTGTCSVNMTATQSVTATFTLQTYALAVTKTGSGTGTVTSNLGGITCGATCSATLDYGTNVILTATASSGSVFAGWSGACSSTGACSVTMTAAQAVTATFNTAPTYTLTVTPAGTGTGTVTSNPSGISCGATCAAAFASGTSVTLTAAPDASSIFTGWSGAGCTGTASCSVTMTAAQAVTATFTPLPTYTLTVTPAGSGVGTVTSSPTGITCGVTCSAGFTSGTNVTLTAVPAAGSVFAGWSGACSGTASCSVLMTAAQAVTATFTPVPTYMLTVTKAGSGTGTVTSNPAGVSCGATCGAGFTSGTNVTLTAAPDFGSIFAGWSGACSGAASCSVTMTAAQAVTATFNTVPTYTLTVTPTGSGVGTVTSSPAGITCGVTCSAGFTSGTNVTLTATPDVNSVFSGWGGVCSGTSSCNVTMDSAKSVTATFNTLTYALTVTLSGTGSGTVTSAPAGINCGSSCSATYSTGTSVTLTAAVASGSFFSGWSGGGCTGTSTCVVSITTARSVTATFMLNSGTNQRPSANNQIVNFNIRQQTTPLYQTQYAITLTGSDPEGGPLTFRITGFPTHQDITQTMDMVGGSPYQVVNPVTGSYTIDGFTTSSSVDLTTGFVTPSPSTGPPVIIYTPNICHEYFTQDVITFVAIDSAGLISDSATVTMNSNANSVTCNHAP